SSSSSKSERQISAWARLRRIRQPPEKSLTGRSSCSLLKPRPCSRLAARERILHASIASSLP
ncbi:hypothetical protein PV945_22240, partial [Bacillus subtilis]|nr:hypothetical protein [Bacillus subtilis]